MTDAPDRALELDAAARMALALIVAFALARLALAATLGPGFDEAYTIVVARRLDLSYFDHPPLHQWIAHYAALAFGEGAATRLPFIALFAATGWLTFALTRRLFDARAGLVALVALNVSAFFLVSAGGWVVPDGPLLFALAGAALTLAKLFFDAPGSARRLGALARGGLVARPRRPVEIQRRAVRDRARRLCRAEPAPAPLVRPSRALSGGAARPGDGLAGDRLELAARLGLVGVSGRARRGGRLVASRAGRRDAARSRSLT